MTHLFFEQLDLNRFTMGTGILNGICCRVVSAVNAQEKKWLLRFAHIADAHQGSKKHRRGRKAKYIWPASYEAVDRKISEWRAKRATAWEDFRMDDLCIETGFPRYVIQNYFQIYLKMDFRQWKTGLKIDSAKHLLTEFPDMPVGRIGSLSGFNDNANFHRQFHRLTGMTPLQWRNEYARF